MKRKKVLVGLSGGVDSAIAAHLLMKEGYEVTGLFMRNWDSIANNDLLGNPNLGEDQCPQEADYYDALDSAKKLGIPLLRCDFVDEYWKFVFSDFINLYKKGFTPNPDVFCNKYIKFDAFLKYAKEHGFDYIAMGHYAKVVRNADGTSSLLKPFDSNKDQTYFLSQISQNQLSFSLFPLSDIDKTEVRRIAKQLGLDVASKKDSTGVCFIGERQFKKFLMNYVSSEKGKIVDYTTGGIIGEHDGVNFYTIGQTKGLGIGGIKGIDSGGWLVMKKDLRNNTLFLAPKTHPELLNVNRVVIRNLSFLRERPEVGKIYDAQFRYREKPFKLQILSLTDDELLVSADDFFYAVTPGQIAVLYNGDEVVGSGIIYETYLDELRMN